MENLWTQFEQIKKTSLGPDFGPFAPNLSVKNFFCEFHLH